MFNSVLDTVKRTYDLNAISHILSEAPPRGLDIYELIGRDKKRKEDMAQLFALVRSNRKTRALLEKYKADDYTLDEIYSILLSFGAGHYAGGFYVPAASLAFASPLNFLLNFYYSPKSKYKPNAQEVTDSVVVYFLKGHVGEVKLIAGSPGFVQPIGLRRDEGPQNARLIQPKIFEFRRRAS